MTLDIVAVDMITRTALCSTGDTFPITDMLDGDGDHTDVPEQAVFFVCGSGDIWFSCRMDAYDFPTIH